DMPTAAVAARVPLLLDSPPRSPRATLFPYTTLFRSRPPRTRPGRAHSSSTSRGAAARWASGSPGAWAPPAPLLWPFLAWTSSILPPKLGEVEQRRADHEGDQEGHDRHRAAVAHAELIEGRLEHVRGHQLARVVGPAHGHDVDQVKVLEGAHQREDHRGPDGPFEQGQGDVAERLGPRRPVDGGR